MKTNNCQITFLPSGRKGIVKSGITIKEAARTFSEYIEGVCGDNATCGKCKVYEVNRNFLQKTMSDLSPKTKSEIDLINQVELDKGCRLACQAKIIADIDIFIPDTSRKTNQIVRKDIISTKVDLDPAIKKYTIELSKPSLDDLLADCERLSKALTSKFKLNNLLYDHNLLKRLQKDIRDFNWNISLDIWKDSEIINVASSNRKDSFGIAFDIGTTTVVGYLCDLNSGDVISIASCMNPQVVFGDDVISRIVYIQTHSNGLSILNKSIIDCLQEILHEVSNKAGILEQDIVDCVVVGNTCMHHIFLNVNPVYLGRSPFIPVIQSSVDVKARDLGLTIADGARIHVLPIEGGFVGPDNVAVLLATIDNLKDETTLILDIGTNGEIILTNNERFLTASCATGPAFEGGEIKFGMKAAPGAIDQITIDEKTNELIYHVMSDDSQNCEGSNPPSGICGSGIIDGVIGLFKIGVINHTGRFTDQTNNPRVRTNNGKLEYVLAWKNETLSGEAITITQSDVRAIQLAKGAMMAGAKILMKKLGVEKIDRVILAGAFGSYIDKNSAISLGLFPQCDIDNVKSVGNAAGDGARMALLNIKLREKASDLARMVEYIELTTEKEFTKEFAKGMWFPQLLNT